MEMPEIHRNAHNGESVPRIKVWEVTTDGNRIMVNIHHRNESSNEIEQSLIRFLGDVNRDFWVSSAAWNMDNFVREGNTPPGWLNEDGEIETYSTLFRRMPVVDLLKTYMCVRRMQGLRKFHNRNLLAMYSDSILGIIGQYVWACKEGTMLDDFIGVISSGPFGELTEEILIQKAKDAVNEEWQKYVVG